METTNTLEVLPTSQPPNDGNDGNDGDELLNTHQAATLCRVSEDRMRALAGDGRVPATMKRHAWWYSRRALEEILAQHPEVIYQRRTPAVRAITQSRRETSRATMLRINAMKTQQERHENAMRGLAGLKRKLALGAGLDPDDQSAENQRAIEMLYQARMASVRARKASARQLTTMEQRVAALQLAAQQVEREEIELKARRQALREHARPTDAAESLAICFDCWRETYGGRVPPGLVNKLCTTGANHQQQFDQFVAELRAAS